MLQYGYRFLILVGLGSGVALLACDNGETTDDTGSGGDSTTTSSTGTPSTTSSVSSSTSGTGGGQNIMCSGSNTNIPEGDCNLLNQNCPPGMGCEPVSAGTTTGCVQGGLKEAAMPCANTDECVGGTACVFGKCAPFCCPDNDQPCNGGFCNVQLGYDGDPNGPFAYVCSFPDACTLFEADQCPVDQDCHPAWEKGISICVGPSSTPKMEGEACDYINDCGDMQTCGPDGMCRYACDLANFATLEPGQGGCANQNQTCVMVQDNQIPNVGICQPM